MPNKRIVLLMKKERQNFCTLFDSNYSAKGLAMYYSLVEHCTSFHLFVFAFDDKLVNALEKMKLEHVTVVPLKDRKSVV